MNRLPTILILAVLFVGCGKTKFYTRSLSPTQTEPYDRILVVYMFPHDSTRIRVEQELEKRLDEYADVNAAWHDWPVGNDGYYKTDTTTISSVIGLSRIKEFDAILFITPGQASSRMDSQERIVGVDTETIWEGYRLIDIRRTERYETVYQTRSTIWHSVDLLDLNTLDFVWQAEGESKLAGSRLTPFTQWIGSSNQWIKSLDFDSIVSQMRELGFIANR